jgi:predicted aspartyl protease
VLVAATVAGCAQPLDLDDALAVVPFEIQAGGRIIVEVELNNRGPYRFAVDTAATGSFLVSRVRSELALEPVPQITATVHGAVASGRFPVVDVDRLTVGSETWNGARLIALPGATGATASIDGVLGADFLRRYAIGFSARERSLRLYLPGSIGAEAYEDWTAIPIEPRFIGQSQEPLHFLEITIAGRDVPALLDLGAGLSVLNPPAARMLRLSAVGTGESGEFSGAVGNEPVLAQFRTQQVRTGRVRWRNETFLITDVGIFETLQSADSPLAILGAGLFRQRDFIIDFERNRLLVRTSMSELEASD